MPKVTKNGSETITPKWRAALVQLLASATMRDAARSCRETLEALPVTKEEAREIALAAWLECLTVDHGADPWPAAVMAYVEGHLGSDEFVEVHRILVELGVPAPTARDCRRVRLILESAGLIQVRIPYTVRYGWRRPTLEEEAAHA